MINATSYINRQPGYIKDSLNSGYCRQVQKEIDEDNQQLVRRLQNANSQYSQRNFSQANKKYDKMKTNIAFSRMDPFYDL